MSVDDIFKMDNSNLMETAGLSPINCVQKQTPLTEAIGGIKLSTNVGNLINPISEAVGERSIHTNKICESPPKLIKKTNDLLEISKNSEMDDVQTESNCQKNSTLEKMDITQTNDITFSIVNNSNCYDDEIDTLDSDLLRNEIFGTLNNMISVNKKITFSDINIPEADKCISSRSGRTIRTRYPKQIHSDGLMVKPIRGQKRKAEINVEDLYTQDRVNEVKCTPLETISEGVEWECGMTKKRRLCQFNSAAVSYDPIPYSPSRAKVRMQKKRAKELGVKVCRGRRVSMEDVKEMLDSISGDEEEEMMEEKTGEMVLIIHGFPNEISALRFEWAWQHPHNSRRLKGIVTSKKSKEIKYDYCLRIVATMLQTKPWSRLPLTIRWLKQQYQADFPAGLDPPNHMPVAYGPVKPTQVTKCKGKAAKVTTEDELPVPCSLCDHVVLHKDKMRCLSKSCFLVTHIKCLADKFLQAEPLGTLLPLESPCPSCHTQLLWGDLIRLKRGCYQIDEGDDDNHWANALSQA